MRTAKTAWLNWALSVLESQHKNSLQFSPTRRKFLKNTSKSALALAIGPSFPGVIGKPSNRIAIIGGGLAGLSCAWKLKKAGFNPIIFEASDRVGGRTMTIHNFQSERKPCEIGGEYFTSDHGHMIKLARELKLRIYTSSSPNRQLKPFKVFFGNQEVPLAELEQSLVSFYQQISDDINSLPEYLSWEYAEAFQHLDQMSITEYLRSKQVDALGYKFLKKAFTLENGLEASEQSAVNLLRTFRSGFVYRPSGRIKSLQLKAGNQAICTELSERMWKNLKLGHRLTNIHQHTDWYTLHFKYQGRKKKVNVDYVVSAIPFSVLRNIETNVYFNERKQSAIDQLGYGQKDNLLLGFQTKLWKEQGYDGLTFSDELFGYGSDQFPRRKSKSNILSIKPSGKEATTFSRMDTASAAMQTLRSFDKIYPGLSKYFDGQALKFSWSTNPNFKGSNSCYKVGQYTQFGGEEGKSVANLFFAGEHCSHHYKGTMNGAIETGDIVASNILRRIERNKRKFRP